MSVDSGRKRKRSIGALALLALAAVQLCPSENEAGCLGGPRRQLEEGHASTNLHTTHDVPRNFTVCGRATDTVEPTQDIAASRELQGQYATCPQYTPQTPLLYLSGHLTFGRTSNHLIALQKALRYARDHEMELGIARESWAMDVMLPYFFAAEDAAEWERNVERELCIKVIHSPGELAGREIVEKSNVEMFSYTSQSPQEEAVAGQLQTLRTLFRHHNTGGVDNYGVRSQDMCSGIDSLFGIQNRASAAYSVIHLRYLEGKPGISILSGVSNSTGCDPRAGLEMRPEYVKSILEPLGMLNHPIVVITDGQSKFFMQRLKTDKDIGPMLRILPESASWIGGDITLATMATVFVGNPASTFSGFIARSRVALGLGHNYLFRAKDGEGGWKTTCGDECLFGRWGQSTPAELRQKQGLVTDKRTSGHVAKMAASRRDMMKWLEGRG